MTDDIKIQLIEALQSRRETSMASGQVDNDALPPGSDLYCYCHSCGNEVAVWPAGWWGVPPPTTCGDCQDLIAHGWHDGEKLSFPLTAKAVTITESPTRLVS